MSAEFSATAISLKIKICLVAATAIAKTARPKLTEPKLPEHQTLTAGPRLLMNANCRYRCPLLLILLLGKTIATAKTAGRWILAASTAKEAP